MLWAGKDLDNLLNMSVDELVVQYPDKTRENLERRKREKKGILTATWEMLTKNAEGEAEVTTLHRYEFPKDSQILNDWKPATAARITPSKRKLVGRSHKRILVFGDMQIDFRRIDDELIPIHDVKAIGALLELARDLQPDEMVNPWGYARFIVPKPF